MSSTLVTIASRLKLKREKEETDIQGKRWKPTTLDNYSVPAFNIPNTRDKKILEPLSRVLTFILERAQALRKKDACTVMPILTGDENVKRIFPNVSRGIKLMIKIGLIEEFNPKFRFGDSRYSYGKMYLYFYENELKFIQYCKDNNIAPIPIKNYTRKNKVIGAHNFIDKERVRLGSKMRLYKPNNLSESAFEELLTDIFYENYPEFEEIQKLSDEINEKYYFDQPNFKIKTRLKFKWSRGKEPCITKIKFRATNSYDNMKKSDRVEILKQLGLELDSDVNASVPRINLSMNKHRWEADENKDLYKSIFEEMYPNEAFTNEDRDAIKQLLLRTYFEDSEGNLVNHIWNKIDKKDLDEKEVESTMISLHKALKKVVGPVMLGTDVYYVEACVYLRVLKDLLDDGVNVWLVYDGFYSEGSMMKELFNAEVKGLIELRFNEFFERYEKNLKSGVGIVLGK